MQTQMQLCICYETLYKIIYLALISTLEILALYITHTHRAPHTPRLPQLLGAKHYIVPHEIRQLQPQLESSIDAAYLSN